MTKFIRTFELPTYALALFNLALVVVFTLIFVSSQASAFELSPGIVLENTVSTEYSIEADKFDSSFESELVYGVNPNLSAHLLATFDLNDPAFTEAQVGVEFTPVRVKGLTASVYSSFNEDLDYKDTVLGLEYKF